MTSNQPVPAQPERFDIQVWKDNYVRPQVCALLPNGMEDWPAFEVAVRAALLKDGKLKHAIAKNPNSALLSIVKCARLGLSLNPADEHFALIPYGGSVEGQAMTRGYMFLAMQSGRVDWLQSEVVYRKEKFSRDTATGVIHHEFNDFERDNFKDEEIVGAYATAKLKGVDRLVSVVLTRKDIEKRRKMGGGGAMWTTWYATACKVKAVKALLRSGMVPLTPTVARAVKELDDEDSGEQPRAIQVLPPELPVAAEPEEPRPHHTEHMDAADAMNFEQRDEQPMPSDEDLFTDTSKQVQALAKEKRLKPAALDLLACRVLDKDHAEFTDINTVEKMRELLDLVRTQ